jgi:hypothetical protein
MTGPMSSPMSGPLTGAVPISNAHMATIAASGPSGSAPIVSMRASGVYPGTSVGAQPRSKVGLIIAILAVLAVGGGVAAFVVVSGRKPGPGPGSQIASNGPEHGPEHGSNGLQDGPGRDASVAIAPDAAALVALAPDAGPGSDAVIPGNGSDHQGSGSAEHDGSNTPPPPEVETVPVVLTARNVMAFQVYENGEKVLDGPDALLVGKGEKRTVVIKAAGFRDKTLVVDSTKKKVQFALSRIPGPGPGPGSGSGHTVITPPPPGPDCSFKILDPKSKACVEQYCAKHPEEDKCHLD